MPFEQPVVVAPRYEERLSKQAAMESLWRSSKEYQYFYPEGQYDTGNKSIIAQDSRHESLEGRAFGLQGMEAYLSQAIRQALEFRPKIHPVLLLDLGGGIGVSCRRLALKYKHTIEESKLAMVVSNLIDSPSQHMTGHFKGFTFDSNLIPKTEGLVHFVYGGVSGLKDQRISLPNGVSLSLQGNIDLVHERLSVTAWSKVPERDIPFIPRLLSDRGIYMVHRRDVEVLHPSEEITEEEQADRQSAIALAHGQLIKPPHHLKKVTLVEVGRKKGTELEYLVFKKPHAPIVWVD